ncbi:Protein FAR1-RELATED SEQUENCE 1, partial [Bienertia sinuspersici]
MRRYLCSKADLKDDSKKRTRCYDKIDMRTDCKAFLQFQIGKDGVWTCVRHEMVHNHEMVPLEKRHLLSGVQVADAIRVMRKEAGGSPMVGFTQRDAYNALAAEKQKQLDGCDCKQLIRISAQRLKATNGLCDFSNVFVDVVSEWRSRGNGEDFNCLRGNRHLAFANVSIVLHAREVYAREVYKIFEEEFVKGTACDQENVGGSFPKFIYYIWRSKVDLIKHQVCFDKESHQIRCTCKYFSEMGILCSHSLRVYHLHCVGRITERYILKRWCKSAFSSQSVEELRDKSKVFQSSMCRAQTLRFLVHFVTTCQDIPLCRDEFEHGLKLLKEKVESIRGPIEFSKGGEDQVVIDMSELSIKDPPLAIKNMREILGQTVLLRRHVIRQKLGGKKL